MSENFDKFINTLETPNTIKVVNSLRAISQYDYSNCTHERLEQIILSLKPNSLRAITTICYVMGLYAKFLKDNQLYDMIQEIDRSRLWINAKPNASKKFISHKKFEEVYHDIGLYEDFNAFYYQTLFKCLYEGIYNDDMSVIKNLRESDIDTDSSVVKLKSDGGGLFELGISNELADDLKELSTLDYWERKNRYSIFKVNIEGLYPDSCFKVENRKKESEYAYRYSYYRILRKIAKEYVGYNLLPLQIYVSGIMYRIGLKLDEHNITIEDAFSDNNKDRMVNKIISNELKRSNYDTEVRNFREMVKGHIEVFTKTT